MSGGEGPVVLAAWRRALFARRRGLTLAEVLVAVLILGLGLLGLAAVFPAVVTQQRRATDAVYGSAAATAAEAAFAPGGYISEFLESQNGEEGDVGSAGRQDALLFGADGGDEDNPFFGLLWETDWAWGLDDGDNAIFSGSLGGANARDDYIATGRITFGGARTESGQVDREIIDASARLYPAPGSGGVPQFVWDFVPRRAPSGDIQAAVFVRRVDAGIRVPDEAGTNGQPITLSDVLTGRNGVAANDRRAPVAFDFVDFRPTRDGTDGNGQPGDYSVPLSVGAELVDNFDQGAEDDGETRVRGRVIELTDGDGEPEIDLSPASGELEASARLLATAGQMCGDNLGVVRRVTGTVEGEPLRLVVDPPYIESALRTDGDGFDADDPGDRARVLRQIVFTPQPPVSVFVRTVGR